MMVCYITIIPYLICLKGDDFIKLYKHQKHINNLLSYHNGFMVFAEQGTGKTLPTLYHITNLFMMEEITSALIVAPKSAIGSWYRDIGKLPARRRVYVDKIEVINYDKFSRKGSKYRQKYDKGVDCIVLDEGHAIKHPTSNRTKYFIGHKHGKKVYDGLNKKSKYRYILTGTPITNGKLHEFWALVEFVAPDRLGTYKEFQAHFCVMRKIPGSYFEFPVAYRNKEELQDIISSLSYRVLKKDCLDLPDKLPDEVIDCEIMEPKIYKQAEKDMVVEMFESTIATKMVQMSKLRQICSGFYIDEYKDLHVLKSEKPKMLQELVESIGNKVVIFHDFKHSHNVIADTLDAIKVKHVSLNGDQKDKLIWEKFQSDDDIGAIIVQYQSGCAGIDLFKSSHTIYFEPPLSSTILEQSRDRTHRIGVSNHCNYYFLITKGTMEEKIYERLVGYQDFTVKYLQEMYERG